MKKSHESLLKQFLEIAKGGKFGGKIKEKSEEIDKIESGIELLLWHVANFYKEMDETDDENIKKAQSIIYQIIIVAYREANRNNPEVATALVNSFTSDYPNVPNTCLLPKWHSLASASLAFKEVHDLNPLVSWEANKQLFQAYNEFLNGLLGYLLLCWRTGQGRDINTDVLTQNYAQTLTQFKDISAGEDGIFYIIFRIAKPRIRNACAHGDIWLDADKGVVRYNDHIEEEEKEVSIEEFLIWNLMGSIISNSYLSALATIAILEEGNEGLKKLIPKRIIELFNFVPQKE